MAEGSRYTSYFIKEVMSGVTPATGALDIFRATKSGLDITIAALQSEEIRGDAEIADFRLGTRSVAGTASAEFSAETFDALLAAALRGTWVGNDVVGGINRQPFTFIDHNGDIPDFPYTIYRGCEINTMAISLSAAAIATIEFGIVGRTMEQATALPAGLTVNPRTTTSPMDGFSGGLSMAGSEVDVITEMGINLENGIEPRFVVGSKFSIKPGAKRRNVKGSLTAYFEDNTLRNRYLEEQESELVVSILDGTTGQGYKFTLPRIKITEAPRPIDGEGDIMLNMSYQALLDGDTGNSIKITRIPAPPRITAKVSTINGKKVGGTVTLAEMFELQASVASDYNYISSDTDTGTVSPAGVVTLLAAGSTNITATHKTNPAVTAMVSISNVTV